MWLAWEWRSIGVNHLPGGQVVYHLGDVRVIKPSAFIRQNANDLIRLANQGKQFINTCFTRCAHAAIAGTGFTRIGLALNRSCACHTS